MERSAIIKKCYYPENRHFSNDNRKNSPEPSRYERRNASSSSLRSDAGRRYETEREHHHRGDRHSRDTGMDRVGRFRDRQEDIDDEMGHRRRGFERCGRNDRVIYSYRRSVSNERNGGTRYVDRGLDDRNSDTSYKDRYDKGGNERDNYDRVYMYKDRLHRVKYNDDNLRRDDYNRVSDKGGGDNRANYSRSDDNRGNEARSNDKSGYYDRRSDKRGSGNRDNDMRGDYDRSNEARSNDKRGDYVRGNDNRSMHNKYTPAHDDDDRHMHPAVKETLRTLTMRRHDHDEDKYHSNHDMDHSDNRYKRGRGLSHEVSGEHHHISRDEVRSRRHDSDYRDESRGIHGSRTHRHERSDEHRGEDSYERSSRTFDERHMTDEIMPPRKKTLLDYGKKAFKFNIFICIHSTLDESDTFILFFWILI